MTKYFALGGAFLRMSAPSFSFGEFSLDMNSGVELYGLSLIGN